MLYPWLVPSWQHLQQLRQRLGHALLITGAMGIGKRQFCQKLAASLLCESPDEQGFACGKCHHCHLRLGNNHPDLLLLSPEEKNSSSTESKQSSAQIRIEQIRQLQHRLSVGSHQGHNRVIIIDPVEAMNVYTANALLKLLEEPPEASYFLLMSDKRRRLLPTILSRCQLCLLPEPTEAQLQSWLQSQPDLPYELLAITGNKPLQSLSLYQRGIYDFFKQFMQEMMDLDTTKVLNLAERWEKSLKSKLAIEAKFDLPILLSWLHRWISDVLLSCLGGDIQFFPSQKQGIQKIAKKVKLSAITACYQATSEVVNLGQHALNIRLLLEDLLIRYTVTIQSERD